MARRGYPSEFRKRVIELVEGGRKVSEVAGDLGISEQTIYTWCRQTGWGAVGRPHTRAPRGANTGPM